MAVVNLKAVEFHQACMIGGQRYKTISKDFPDLAHLTMTMDDTIGIITIVDSQRSETMYVHLGSCLGAELE